MAANHVRLGSAYKGKRGLPCNTRACPTETHAFAWCKESSRLSLPGGSKRIEMLPFDTRFVPVRTTQRQNVSRRSGDIEPVRLARILVIQPCSLRPLRAPARKTPETHAGRGVSPAHDGAVVGQSAGEVAAGGDAGDDRAAQVDGREVIAHLPGFIATVVRRALCFPRQRRDGGTQTFRSLLAHRVARVPFKAYRSSRCWANVLDPSMGH